MSDKIKKQAALDVTAQLDRVANTFQQQHQHLNVPEDVARDFAYRCDLLSDHIEKNAAVEKEALTELDVVKEPGFDPEEVGVEKAGPQEGDSDEKPYMGDEFTQQENRELRERVQDGDISNVKTIDDPQKPQPGKQAEIDVSISKLEKQAFADTVRELSGLSDDFQIVQAGLNGSNPSLAKKVASGITSHINALESAKKKIIASSGALSLEQMDAVGKIISASREVSPYLSQVAEYLKKGHDGGSPTSLLEMEEMVEQKSGRLARLITLSAGIVTKAAKEISGSKKKEASTEELFS